MQRRGLGLQRHHVPRLVCRPHLQSVLREGCACRFSLILSTLGDRSNPPPDSDDSDDDLEYDIYGWFNFETDAEGVQRLDRKWVPLAAAAAAEDFSDALDAYEERLEAKKKDFQ